MDAARTKFNMTQEEADAAHAVVFDGAVESTRFAGVFDVALGELVPVVVADGFDFTGISEAHRDGPPDGVDVETSWGLITGPDYAKGLLEMCWPEHPELGTRKVWFDLTGEMRRLPFALASSEGLMMIVGRDARGVELLEEEAVTLRIQLNDEVFVMLAAVALKYEIAEKAREAKKDG